MISIMEKEKVCIQIRLTNEEKEKLEHDSALCGLTQREYIRQICRGEQPKILPGPGFWDMMETVYRIHGSLKRCAGLIPEAEEECRRLEALVLRLTEAA